MPPWSPISLRREARFGDRAAVLVETTLLRRKATAKFADPADWLFTDEALQQATADAGRAHRARRLAGAGRARRDLFDRHRACRASQLGGARGRQRYRPGPPGDGQPQRAPTSTCAAPTRCIRSPATRSSSLDPARRSGGRRRFDPRDYTPAARRAARRVPGSRSGREVRARNRFRCSCRGSDSPARSK